MLFLSRIKSSESKFTREPDLGYNFEKLTFVNLRIVCHSVFVHYAQKVFGSHSVLKAVDKRKYRLTFLLLIICSEQIFMLRFCRKSQTLL